MSVQKNWVKQQAELPEDLQPVDGPTLWFAQPMWHGDIHQVPCKTENLLSYQTGSTKVDGECPEHFWGTANPFSNVTKEMGPGTRHNDLECKIDSYNHLKNIGLGTISESHYRKSFLICLQVNY